MTKKLLFQILLLLFVVSAICYVPIRSYKQNGTSAIFAYFAGDSFYYLNVADKSANKNFYTYDGVNPTNGFHPLWQYYLTYAFKFIPEKNSQLTFAFFSSMIFTAFGYGLIVLALFKLLKNEFLAILTLIPGFFYLLFSFILGHHYSPWSFINGMESGFSIFSFGILLILLINFRLLENLNLSKVLILAVSISLIGFSRLDDFFLLPAFALGLLFQEKKISRNLITLISIPSFLILVYLVYNQSSTGMLLPVSGTEKNAFYPLNLLHIINLFSYGGSIRDLYGLNLAQRVLPLVFPAIISLIYLFGKKKQKVFSILSVYILIKAFYNLLFVDFWNQGVWYFVDSVIIANLIIGCWLKDIFLESDKELMRAKIMRISANIGLILFIFAFMNSFIDLKRFHYNEKYSKFWNNRSRIEKEIRKIYDGKGILEFDDGILAYSLNYACLSGFGLNFDKEAIQAKKEGRLLDLAYSRGISVMGSLNYFYAPEQIKDSLSEIKDFGRKPFFGLDGQNLFGWQFSVLFKDSKTGTIFVRFNKLKLEKKS